MTDHTPLSPAAQAVLDAWLKSENGERMLGDPACLAVALRAAADQVAVESIWHGHPEHTGVRWAAEGLRTIAAELEGQQSTSSTH